MLDQELIARCREATAAVVAPAVRQLRGMGLRPKGDTLAPVICCAPTVVQIRAIARWPGVDRIYLDRRNTPDMHISRQYLGANFVNYSRRVTGLGVRIAQIEVGGRVAGNPFLTRIHRDTENVSRFPSLHSTGVAGILTSSNLAHTGIAPHAELRAGGSAQGWNSELDAAASRAVTWGARALNLSFGHDSGRRLGDSDRYYDSIVYAQYRTVVKSAGNENGGCRSGNGNVTSPGLAYNVITVGNLDDRRTRDIRDDRMNGCSSFRDPRSTFGDREQPEVTAPGTEIRSTIPGQLHVGNIGSGTSFAAPMVTGTVALMLQRDRGLRYWPESVKAILMATAVHNVEGAARLSEHDGAGRIDIARADSVAFGSVERPNLTGDWGGVLHTCASARVRDVDSIYLMAGRRYRVVIAWSVNPDYRYYDYRPGADVDLLIADPVGYHPAASTSYDNSYEIVDFRAQRTGWHKIRVRRHRCDGSPRFLGWAWHKVD